MLAANIDTVFLVSGLDQEFNLRRIERYLALAVKSQARPVIVLNKSDLHPDPHNVVQRVKETMADFPVLCLSAKKKTGFEARTACLQPGRTLALIGSGQEPYSQQNGRKTVTKDRDGSRGHKPGTSYHDLPPTVCTAKRIPGHRYTGYARETKVALMHASRIKSRSNGMKNYRGKRLGIERLDLVEKKRAKEERLQAFIESDPRWQDKQTLIRDIHEIYEQKRQTFALHFFQSYLSRNSYLFNCAKTLYTAALERQKPDDERQIAYTDRKFAETIESRKE